MVKFQKSRKYDVKVKDIKVESKRHPHTGGVGVDVMHGGVEGMSGMSRKCTLRYRPRVHIETVQAWTRAWTKGLRRGVCRVTGGRKKNTPSQIGGGAGDARGRARGSETCSWGEGEGERDRARPLETRREREAEGEREGER
ncbi:hypothetical protein BJV77DRAFT_962079 [Russula vinacea]|nr:hypothetical protein BJV77DRAFT_962079 [Russula vinacea]